MVSINKATYLGVVPPKRILTHSLEINPYIYIGSPVVFPLCNFPQIKFLLVTHSLQRVNFLSLNISVLMIEVLLSVVNYLECLLYIKAFPGTGDVSLIDCLS